MSEKHEEGRGTSPSAFTPVGGVGFPIEAARDAHSGYIGDHNKRHGPVYLPCASSDNLQSQKLTPRNYRSPEPPASSNSETERARDPHYDSLLGTRSSNVASREQVVQFFKLYQITIPKWLSDATQPLDMERVKKLAELMEVILPEWFSNVEPRETEIVTRQPAPMKALKKDNVHREYNSDFYNKFCATQRNEYAPLNADALYGRQRMHPANVVHLREYAVAPPAVERRAVDAFDPAIRSANANVAPCSAAPCHKETEAEPQRGTLQKTSSEYDSDRDSDGGGKVHSGSFSSFNIADPKGSLNMLELELRLNKVRSPRRKLLILKDLVGGRIWKRYVDSTQGGDLSYTGYCAFLRRTLKQEYNCLGTYCAPTVETFDERYFEIMRCPLEAMQRFFILNQLSENERAIVSATHDSLSIPELADRVRDIIRAGAQHMQRRDFDNSPRSSYQNTVQNNYNDRKFNYPRQAGKGKRNRRPALNAADAQNNGSGYVCRYHKRFKDNAFSCEGPPCVNFSDQKVVQPWKGTNDALATPQQPRALPDQGNWQPRATQ